MSSIIYIASDAPLAERINPHEKMLSVNEAIALGVSNIPDFLLDEDFDKDKPGVILVSDREINIDIDNGVIEDGDFDDDFSVWISGKEPGMKTKKKYCGIFECMKCTKGRAEMFVEYLREQLKKTSEIEIWHVGLDNEPRRIETVKISEVDLKAEDIIEMESKDVWCEPRTDYCYLIVREKKLTD